MLTTLAFLAALPLAPAQAGNLGLTGARLTYGILGPARAENKVLPDDDVVVHFDIENARVDKDGKVQYSTSLEVTDPSGKVIFNQPPRDAEVYNTLGGTTVPAYAVVHIGADQAPGEYGLKVIVKDRLADKSATLTQKIQVLPKGFGLVRLATTSDLDGRHPAGVLSVGESLYINALVVGCGRGPNKQPNLAVEMRILDDQNKPTLPKPFADVIDKDVPEKATMIPLQFLVSLNRAGKFTVEIKVTDKVNNKELKQLVPFTVVPNR